MNDDIAPIIVDQDRAQHSLCSAGENFVSWAEPLMCNKLFSTLIFLLNLLPVYWDTMSTQNYNNFP